jgi:mannitol-1-phosphate 5-dehydrogenase
MLESAMALSKKYGADLMALQLHITDLLYRFTNAALKDTCQRVGGDPARKLSPADRLIGSSKLILEQGMTPAYITVGAAAGLHRYIKETEGAEQNVATAAGVLSEVAGLDAEDALAKLILSYYEMLLGGCSLSDLCVKADVIKHESMHSVI